VIYDYDAATPAAEKYSADWSFENRRYTKFDEYKNFQLFLRPGTYHVCVAHAATFGRLDSDYVVQSATIGAIVVAAPAVTADGTCARYTDIEFWGDEAGRGAFVDCSNLGFHDHMASGGGGYSAEGIGWKEEHAWYTGTICSTTGRCYPTRTEAKDFTTDEANGISWNSGRCKCCSGHGTHIPSRKYAGKNCKCDPGWTGHHCDQPHKYFVVARIGEDHSIAGAWAKQGTPTAITVSLNQAPMHNIKITCMPTNSSKDGSISFGSSSATSGVVTATTSAYTDLTLDATFSDLGCASITCVACPTGLETLRRKLGEKTYTEEVSATEQLFNRKLHGRSSLGAGALGCTFGPSPKNVERIVFVFNTDLQARYNFVSAGLHLRAAHGINGPFTAKVQIMTSGVRGYETSTSVTDMHGVSIDDSMLSRLSVMWSGTAADITDGAIVSPNIAELLAIAPVRTDQLLVVVVTAVSGSFNYDAGPESPEAQIMMQVSPRAAIERRSLSDETTCPDHRRADCAYGDGTVGLAVVALEAPGDIIDPRVISMGPNSGTVDTVIKWEKPYNTRGYLTTSGETTTYLVTVTATGDSSGGGTFANKETVETSMVLTGLTAGSPYRINIRTRSGVGNGPTAGVNMNVQVSALDVQQMLTCTDCSGNGVCSDRGLCSCIAPFSAAWDNPRDCTQSRCNDNNNVICGGHGTCDSYGKCSCSDDWEGTRCDWYFGCNDRPCVASEVCILGTCVPTDFDTLKVPTTGASCDTAAPVWDQDSPLMADYQGDAQMAFLTGFRTAVQTPTAQYCAPEAVATDDSRFTCAYTGALWLTGTASGEALPDGTVSMKFTLDVADLTEELQGQIEAAVLDLIGLSAEIVTVTTYAEGSEPTPAPTPPPTLSPTTSPTHPHTHTPTHEPTRTDEAQREYEDAYAEAYGAYSYGEAEYYEEDDEEWLRNRRRRMADGGTKPTTKTNLRGSKIQTPRRLSTTALVSNVEVLTGGMAQVRVCILYSP
jgi:hypothetical protein